MTKTKHLFLLIIIAISMISFSCSKNSTGIADLDIDFPNTVGSHWTYEVDYVMEEGMDTVDVDILDDTIVANKSATIWSFDYHCVLDTGYVTIGDETLQVVIRCIPPPDTSIVVIKADSVTLINESFFSFDKFVMRFPLSVDKSWDWDGDILLREKHTSEVISIGTMTVKEIYYDNVYEIRSYHDVGFYGDNFDYIKSVYWFVPDVGIIKLVESKIKIEYVGTAPLEQYVGIISWELVDYSIAD